jgi:hypothetical protein
MSIGTVEYGPAHRKQDVTVSLGEATDLVASLQDPHDSDAIALAQTPTTTVTLNGAYTSDGLYTSPGDTLHGYMTYTNNADESLVTATIVYRNNALDGWRTLAQVLSASTGAHFLSIAPYQVQSITLSGAATSWIEFGVSLPFSLDGDAVNADGEMEVPDGFFRELTVTTYDNETSVDLQVSYTKGPVDDYQTGTLELPNNDTLESGVYPYKIKEGRLTGLLTSPIDIGLANTGYTYPITVPEYAHSVSVGVTLTGTLDVDLQHSLDPFDTEGNGFDFPAFHDSDSSVPMTSLNSGYTGTTYSGAVRSFRIWVNSAQLNSTISTTTKFYTG